MANSFEIIKYKQQIGSMLINCPEIVELINNDEIEEPEDLIGKIFSTLSDIRTLRKKR